MRERRGRGEWEKGEGGESGRREREGRERVTGDEEAQLVQVLFVLHSLLEAAVLLVSFLSLHHQVWLSDLSREMQATLTELLVHCVEEGRGEGGGGIIDPRKYPQQILCLAEQVLFTERCEAAITEGRLAELMIELEAQLDSYTSADISVS